MQTTQTTYQHILLNENGTPIIAGTRTKVIEVVLDKIAYGWSPEEMALQHPYLSLSQIHSAFAYYYDHQRELDEDIWQRYENVEQVRIKAQPSTLQIRLRREGLLN